MKIDRRKFLTTAAALAALPRDATRGEEPGAPLKIDCQSHLFAPEMVALMEKRTSDPTVFTKDGVRYVKMGDWLRKIPPLYLDADAKLATMDAAGIARTALSINDPGPEWFGADTGRPHPRRRARSCGRRDTRGGKHERLFDHCEQHHFRLRFWTSQLGLDGSRASSDSHPQW